MTVIGLDVGYSNLKIAVGDAAGSPRTLVRPAGAAPLDRLGERIGSARQPDAVVVDVDGQPWAAAIEPARLEGWQRSLHADYAATPAYRALVKAALVLAGRPLVERLVTGLVLDAGYYSFDWALVVAGELRRGASGTSLEAMSVLLERAAGRIAEQQDGRPQPLALEAALRQGRELLLVLGQRVPLKPVLEGAAREVGGVALEALRQSLRREVTNVDLVVVTGGGGALYGGQAADLFPGARVRLARDPVGANARGFFHYGRR